MSSCRFQACGSRFCGPTRSRVTIVSSPRRQHWHTLRPAPSSSLPFSGKEKADSFFAGQNR